jgi:uncharacterized RDD family membrane protein YckC
MPAPSHATSVLSIRTPEGVAFSYPLAGPIVRFLAWWIDALAILGINIGLSSSVAFVAAVSPDIAGAIFIIGAFIVSIGYGMFLEWIWYGQTLGKKFFGLRVIDDQALRLRGPQIIMRNLLRAIDSLPIGYAIGGAFAYWHPQCKRLGDLVGRTVVILARPEALPDLAQIAGAKYNSFRNYPHLEARLRQQVGVEMASLGLRALIRRDQLESGPRARLFARLANLYRKLVRFPDEATESLTDEQYVRNVVDSILRPKSKNPTVAPAA